MLRLNGQFISLVWLEWQFFVKFRKPSGKKFSTGAARRMIFQDFLREFCV
jgi:hypothetical protein